MDIASVISEYTDFLVALTAVFVVARDLWIAYQKSKQSNKEEL